MRWLQRNGAKIGLVRQMIVFKMITKTGRSTDDLWGLVLSVVLLGCLHLVIIYREPYTMIYAFF